MPAITLLASSLERVRDTFKIASLSTVLKLGHSMLCLCHSSCFICFIAARETVLFKEKEESFPRALFQGGLIPDVLAVLVYSDGTAYCLSFKYSLLESI